MKHDVRCSLIKRIHELSVASSSSTGWRQTQVLVYTGSSHIYIYLFYYQSDTEIHPHEADRFLQIRSQSDWVSLVACVEILKPCDSV